MEQYLKENWIAGWAMDLHYNTPRKTNNFLESFILFE